MLERFGVTRSRIVTTSLERRMRTTILAFLMLAAISGQQALADESIQPIAASGDWVALQHVSSMLASPDVCIAADVTGGIGLRFSDTGMELRVFNTKWSLPATATGTVVLQVAGHTYKVDAVPTDATTLSGSIDASDIKPLLDEMTQAAAMQITVGKAAPASVSLAGSGKVLSAFRTCAGIPGTSGGGVNPFQ